MPELVTRLDNEERLAAALLLLFRDFEREALADPRNVNWSEFRERFRRAVETELSAVFRESSINLARDLADEMDIRLTGTLRLQVQQDADNWAANYANALSQVVTNTTRDKVSAAVQAADTQASLAAALMLVFNQARAEGIAATEVTRAVSRGERDARDRVNDATGILVVPYWFTEMDGRVCKICKPLHKAPEREWKNRFPVGPPAHPYCRCWLEYEVGMSAA